MTIYNVRLIAEHGDEEKKQNQITVEKLSMESKFHCQKPNLEEDLTIN